MGYMTADVYYQPEAFGLTVLGELNDPQACYSFDDLVVWLHEDGTVYWASDSGCSCPSPFEWATKLADLETVTAESWSEFAQAVAEHCVNEPDSQAADRTQLLAKVSSLI